MGTFRDILIFAGGSTPQIITETLYALRLQTPPVDAGEVFIITTKTGSRRIKDTLIKGGILNDLMQEYCLPGIELNDSSFIVPKDHEGKEIEDIRDERDNELMGDVIMTLVREHSQDPGTRLHCSIAGGRKTMSFYLGSALQLFGRPWDKLYHVLVTPEFESNPDFYFPPKNDKIIECNGKKLHTRDAVVTLTELPFIRLRDKLSLNGKGFRELVAEGQREIDIAEVRPPLVVKLSEKLLVIGDKSLKLTPVQLMIYAAYLRRKLDHCRFPDRPYCLDCAECFPGLLDMATKPALEEMAKDYMNMCPSRVPDLLHRYKTGLTIDVIRQAISKIKKAISETLNDETLSAYYAITTSLRGYTNTRHGIRAEKGRMRIQ